VGGRESLEKSEGVQSKEPNKHFGPLDMDNKNTFRFWLGHPSHVCFFLLFSQRRGRRCAIENVPCDFQARNVQMKVFFLSFAVSTLERDIFRSLERESIVVEGVDEPNIEALKV